MALSPNRKELTSIYYHNKFDYPLTSDDLKKWSANFKLDFPKKIRVKTKDVDGAKYFFLGSPQTVNRRIKREKQSSKKLIIAKKAANFLKLIPSIKFVGLTGSTAMLNADVKSDIDLMIITSSGMLWITRGLSLIMLKIVGFKLRKHGDKNEKDKLCLNLWLDEFDLKWKEKNEFIAHEIAQVVPLVNKNKLYEKFLSKNNWITNFWPNAVEISKIKSQEQKLTSNIINWLAFKLQYLYMKKKITNEVVSLTRAQFHPDSNQIIS